MPHRAAGCRRPMGPSRAPAARAAAVTERNTTTSRALALAADVADGRVLREEEVLAMLDAADAVLYRDELAAHDEARAAEGGRVWSKREA